jgi:hypothetical protein
VPKVQPAIDAIAEHLGLEYFGIDCNLNEAGEMLVFEANANMNEFFNTRSRSTEVLGIIRKHLRRLLEHRSIPPGVAGGSLLPSAGPHHGRSSG